MGGPSGEPHNSKSEIRSTKSETNSKHEIQMTKTLTQVVNLVLNSEFWSFVLVSDFDIRISDF